MVLNAERTSRMLPYLENNLRTSINSSSSFSTYTTSRSSTPDFCNKVCSASPRGTLAPGLGVGLTDRGLLPLWVGARDVEGCGLRGRDVDGWGDGLTSDPVSHDVEGCGEGGSGCVDFLRFFIALWISFDFLSTRITPVMSRCWASVVTSLRML